MARGPVNAWLIVAVATLRVAASGPPAIASGAWASQVYAQAPADNPLKGFMPYRGSFDTFPHSMEWATIPWNDLQRDVDVFTWEPLEMVLDDVARRGHQATFRIYADSPNSPSALPGFLSGVARRDYTDHANGTDAVSYAPDYDDRRLVRAMLSAIKALGARYDGDPRIAFITVGFIGFWGEWHTYRPSCDCDEWMPSKATARAVLEAFDEAFARTRLLVRNPDVGWKKDKIGFHDDSFAYHTVDPPDWMFLGRLKKADAVDHWRRQPIGGELRPELQHCTFSLPSCNPAGQDFALSVEATHASWLIDHHAFQAGHAGADYERAMAGARRLGYELFVSAVKLSDTKPGDAVKVEIKMQNRGVAPFYYDWPVRLGVADEHGQVVASVPTGWRLTRVVDAGDEVRFRAKVKGPTLRPGTYTVLLRAENPLPNGKPLVFANAAWQQDVSAWLSLGEIRVRAD